jgi:hypothetical protein
MDAQTSTQGDATHAPPTAASAATAALADAAADAAPAANGGTEPATQQPQDGAANSTAAANQQQAVAPPTLEDQLQQRQRELQHTQSRLTTLQSDIKELQAGINDVSQAKKSYDTSLPNAAQNQTALCAASQVTLDIAKAKLDASTIQSIEDEINGGNDTTDQLTQARKTAEVAVETTAKAMWEAAQAVPAAQAAVDEQKDLPKKLAAMLKDVTSLIDQGEKAFNLGDFAASYFYAKEAVTIVKTPIPTPEEFEAKLRCLSSDLESKKHDATNTKVKADTAQAALKQATAALDAQKVARRNTTLANIRKA